MSLHALANHMATKGRNGDSMLVHMTPGEVAGLHALALKHGGELTTNPDTGLPEASFLKSLLPMLAGAALNFFVPGLGAAVGGAFGVGAAAGTGIAVGGLTSLATGSLSRGLMAGLGAYGGAGMVEGIAGLGAGELAQQQISANMPTLAEGATQAQIADYTQQVNDLRTAGLQGANQLPMADKFSAGFESAKADPLQFARNNMMPLAAAAGPIAADMMTPTVTKMPNIQGNDTINQFIYGPNGQYRSLNPVPAKNYGTPAFKPFNEGGIVALAHGGVPGYADGMLVGDQQVFDYFKNLDQSKLGSGALDAQIAKDMQTYNVGAADIARITGTQAQQGDYEKRFVQQVAQPDTTAAQFLAQTSDVGLQNQGLATALQNSGLSAAAQYAATHSDVGTAGGLAGLSQNINTALADPNLTLQQAQTEMGKYGLNDADVARATGRSTTDIFDTRAADAEAKASAERNAAAAAASKLSADRAAAEKLAADKAAADKAAAEKAIADKAIADKAAADKIAADKFTDKFASDKAAAAKAAADKIAADKDIADKIAADDKAFADRAAAAKAALDAKTKKAADEDAAARIKGAADKAAYEKAAADKAIADKAAADKAAADKAAADKLAADAAAKAAADKALADGLSLAAAAAAADKARREAEAIARAAADKAAADAAAAANTVSSIGTVNLGTNTGVSQDKTDSTSTGLNALASNIPGAITSNITTDGTYVGTTGTTPAVGTKVGVGTIAGTGTEASTGTTGPIINYGGTPGFTVAPLTLAQTQIAQQAADLTAAQNKQLDLYRGFVTQNPNATDLEHANFMDKINLSPDVAARATPLSGQQMKNRYYDAKYNKMTGDSQAAYNFLMGKGAYPTKSGVGQIARPYAEATLGYPGNTNQEYIFDPQTRSYRLNQDYVAKYNDPTGGVNYLMSPNEIAAYFRANQGQADSTTYDWAVENNLTPEEIASATGVPLSTVAAKWRAAKAKKAATTKTDADKAAAAAGKTETLDASSTGGGGGVMAAGGIAGYAMGGMPMYAVGGGLGSLGSYSDGGRLLRGPGDGVSDSIPATIGQKQQPARLADGEFVVPARIVSELGNGSTDAGAKKLYAMMDRVQRARGKTTGKNKVAANSRADKYLPA